MKSFLIIATLLILTAGTIYFFVFEKDSQKDETKLTTSETTDLTTIQSTRPMDGPDSFALNVCEEVSQEIVENTIGKSIEEVESLSSGTDTNCKYFTNVDKYEHILIQVNYLSAENQKSGQEMTGRTVTSDKSIPMENFLAFQDDGLINAIYLVMTPDKFVRVDRTANTANDEQLLDLAKQVAEIILGR